MKLVVGVLLLCLIASIASGTRLKRKTTQRKREPEERCYPDLECFNKKDFRDPSHRNDPHLPDTREDVGTHFYLVHRQNKTNITSYHDPNVKEQIKIVGDKAVTFIVHGFTGSEGVDWMWEIAKGILSLKETNIIIVSWEQGATWSLDMTLGYDQAASNTWIVGGEIWLLSKFLNESFGVQFGNIHVIGHSLGGQVAGYAGARFKGELGRISALDPADPEFEGTRPNIRIDPTDAKLVDVIHTDASPYSKSYGYGMLQPAGHLDFYPNGGITQPGCAWYKMSRDVSMEPEEEERIGCHHARSTLLFIASIKLTCPFIGHECDSYESFIRGKCNSCGANGERCARMGYHANEHPNPNGTINRKLYFITSDSSPYCLYHYSFELVLRRAVEETNFYIQLVFYGTEATHSISDIWISHIGKDSIKQVIGIPNNLGPVKKLEIRTDASWRKLTYPYASVPVEKIIVQSIDLIEESKRNAATTTLCQNTQEDIKEDKLYTFKSSNCQ